MTKRKWQEWWESTGKPVSEVKKQGAKIDQEAFQMAWELSQSDCRDIDLTHVEEIVKL